MKKSIIKKLLSITAIALIPLLCGSSIKKECVGFENDKSKYNLSLHDDSLLKNNTLNTIRFKKIECGFHHCLALDENDRLWAWGSNESGQIGNGSTDSVNHPIQIMPQKKFKDIAASYYHSGALDFDGNGYTWGGGNTNPTMESGNFSNISATTGEYRDKIFLTNSSTTFNTHFGYKVAKTIIGNGTYDGYYLFLDDNNYLRFTGNECW